MRQSLFEGMMIEFYRPADCENCAKIEDALKEMVLAHKIIQVPAGQQPQTLPPDTPLPALLDSGQIISGQSNIEAHMDVLAKVVDDWRRFQSDACYIDEDGSNC